MKIENGDHLNLLSTDMKNKVERERERERQQYHDIKRMKERQVGVKRQERKSELYRVSSRQHRAFERKRNGYCLLYDIVRRTDTSSSVYASECVCV